MRVGELAKRTGASIRSLHYYEQMGVLHAQRQKNGYRSYGPEAVEQVQRIRTLLHLGFVLTDIQLLAPCFMYKEQGTPLCAVAIERYQQKLAELDKRIWVHTFAPLTLDDIRTLLALSVRYAHVPVILGHLGGLNWIETIKLAKEHPQVYLDLSATYTTLAPALAIRELPERSLFSSDAPYGNPLVARVMIEQITADPIVRAMVLGETIARLVSY